MKQNILVQIFTSVHPILSVYIFTGSKTIFAKKKIRLFQLKNFRNFFLSKSVLGYYKKKKKKKKKVAQTTKSLGGWGLNPQWSDHKKNTFFYVCLPLLTLKKYECPPKNPPRYHLCSPPTVTALPTVNTAPPTVNSAPPTVTRLLLL